MPLLPGGAGADKRDKDQEEAARDANDVIEGAEIPFYLQRVSSGEI